MLIAMSNTEKWLSHTKSGHVLKNKKKKKKKWSSRAEPGILKNGRHALTLDIFKKSRAF